MIGSIIGYAIGGIGTAVAVYSLYRQKKLEERLKLKDKIKSIAEKIKELENKIGRLLDYIALKNPDLKFSVYDVIAKDLVAYHFDTGQKVLNITLRVLVGPISGRRPFREISKVEDINIKNNVWFTIESSIPIGNIDEIGYIFYIFLVIFTNT